MRVLVVGGGHASLPLLANARELRPSGHGVTLISDCDRLWYSGMTPEYLGGVYTHADVTIDLGAICEREGVRFVPEPAVHLDPEARFVETASGSRLPYDVLAVDVGAANPATGRAPEAVRTKPLHRIGALAAFLHEVAVGESERTLAIVGGGAAGVEVALNVSAHPQLRGRLAVTIIEPGEALVSGFPPRARRWAADRLRSRGVALRFGTEVIRAEGHHLDLSDGSSLLADRVLWATGSVGQSWLAEVLPADAQGFVRAGETLQVSGHPHVFVAGDAAVVEGHEGLARVGVHAVKQGPTLRRNVRALADALGEGKTVEAAGLERWAPYPAAPLILSSGERDALFVVGSLALHGAWALALKHRVDRAWIEPYLSHPPSWSRRTDLRAAAQGPTDSTWETTAPRR